MKKILVITQNFAPEIGSSANRMTKICQLLNEKADLTILTSEPQYPSRNVYEQKRFYGDETTELNIQRIKTRTNQFEKNLFSRSILYLEIFFKFYFAILKDSNHYDVIYVTSPPLTIPLIGILAKKKFRCQLVVEIRDLWPETLRAFSGKFIFFIMKFSYVLERWIYKSADKIVVNSEGFIDYIRSIVGDEKEIVFLPNSLRKNELERKKKENQTDNITVIYTGNMGFAQDLENLLKLAVRFQEKSNIKFLFIGYGAKFYKMKRKIEEYQLPNTEIKFPEPRRSVLERIRAADIAYVGLSKHYVYKKVIPGKIIDYMGMGIPIIGNTYGYSKNIIEVANAGWIYDKEDFMGLEKGFEKLVMNKELAKKLGQSGKQYALENYNWEQNKKILYQLIFEN